MKSCFKTLAAFMVVLLLTGSRTQVQAQTPGNAQPVMSIAGGVQPLMPTPEERAAAGSNQQQPALTPAGAKALPCPAAGAAIDLDSGVWALGSDCTTRGLNLRGDAQLWVENLALRVEGNISLEQNAGVHIHGGSFNLANQFKFQYHLTAKGHALLDFRDVKVAMNAGAAANLTSSYQGSDDSRFHIENVQIEPTHSWILVNLRDRAQVETKDSPHFPSEIYPTADSTVRIEGARSMHRVWLYFLPGSSAVFENLPATHPFTFSFGRNKPGVTGIGYQVDVINGNVDFGIRSFPRSEVKVRNVSGNLGADIQFSDATTPESLTGLRGGMQTTSYSNQGRVLSLENVEVPPYGWQLYSTNDGISLASAAPVTVTDSLVNEMGAFKNGRFEVEHVHFAFAGIAAVGPKSLVHIRDSVINSHTIMGNSDGVVQIEDSEIQGSRVQAIGNSRILILNTRLGLNERGPNCMPLLSSWNGVPLTRCNPANPAHETQFVVRDHGEVFVAGINTIAAAIRPGESYVFVGNAIVETPDHRSYTYLLRYHSASTKDFTTLVTGGAGPKLAQPLAQFDTKGLAPGEYTVELELVVPGEEPVVVRRPFTIAAP